MVKEVKGDLLCADEMVLAHQVNCVGIMGGGVAFQIRNRMLTVDQYQQYRRMCSTFGMSLMGTCHIVKSPEGKYIANLFAEGITTGTQLDTDYHALRKALHSLKKAAEKYHLSVALPGYIGCGLAGGDWDLVYRMIMQIFNESSLTVTLYYIGSSIEKLWEEFGEVPMNPETECLEQAWHGFSEGTNRETIWHWFEDTFQVSVAQDLMNL